MIFNIFLLVIGSFEYHKLGFEGSATSLSEIAQAFYGGLFAYDGW